MIRTVTTTFLAAFVLAGTALGQYPYGSQGPSAALPPPTEVLQPAPNQAPTPNAASPMAVPNAFAPALPTDAPCCSQSFSVWGNVSYMLGWAQGEVPPPLVTTSPAGTPRTAAGVIPGATVLFGNKTENQEARSGVQADFGYWFDPDHLAAVEGGFFMLGGRGTSYLASSDGSVILARPFTNSTTGIAASSLVAFPGLDAGSIHITDDSRQIWSAGFDLRENFYIGTYWRFDALLGYRFFQLNEQLQIQESVQPLSGPFVHGTTINSTDTFATGNDFNGIDLGVRGTFTYDAFSMELTGRVAAGRYEERLTVNGSQVVTVPGSAPVTGIGGLYALASNIGPHGTHTFGAIPEFGVLINYQVNQYTFLKVGYDALWLLHVIRPGLEIDQSINPSLIPPSTVSPTLIEHPQALSNTTYVLVQGITFGVEFRY